MKTIEGKIVVLGSQGVGKTSVILRYVTGLFTNPVSQSIGASFFSCKLNVDQTRVKLQIWDTAGQERFRSMTPMYYRNANAALLVFDLTQHQTLATIKSWVAELRANVEEQMVIVVVGNKSDLPNREVDAEQGRSYATQIGAIYHETSALHDEGITSVFLTIAKALIRLSTGTDLNNSLRVYDSMDSDLSSPNMPLTPSSEECLPNNSIAHDIYEKSYACC